MTGFLLSPIGWLLIGIALAVPGQLYWRRSRWPLAAALLLVLASLAMMTPLASNTLLAWLERPRASDPDCRASSPAVVVALAGGVSRAPRDDSDFEALDDASRRRTDAAISRWREQPDGLLVFVGGPSHHDRPANARLMAAYARWAGVPGERIRLEVTSLDTMQNAAGVAAMPLPRRITLVTSAMHMPRARAAFAARGLSACPLPADFRRVPHRLPWSLLPRSSALVASEDALHELAGLAWMRLRSGNREAER